jgi:hypothetical protein
MKLGRLRSTTPPKLHLKSYLNAALLPTPPTSVNYTTKAATSLGSIFMNDVLGCCVIAAARHILGVLTGNAGAEEVATDEEIKADYSAVGGWDPKNSSATDNGCDMQTAIDYYKSKGRIVEAISIDATDPNEMRLAIWLFEHLYLGGELPDPWITPFPSASDFVWDDAGEPNPQNGHAIMACAYDENGYKICSWGLLGTLTNRAAARYYVPSVNGEAHVLISREELVKASQKAPNGFDWTSLIANFDALGGHLPKPPPTAPDLPPAPAPKPGASKLSQVTAYLIEHWGQHPLTPSGIQALVTRGIQSNWKP